MITVKFSCSGCDAEAPGKGPLYHRFHGINGKNYGFGHYIWDTPDKVTPDGWTASDLVGATYCPSCTKELQDVPAPKQTIIVPTPSTAPAADGEGE